MEKRIYTDEQIKYIKDNVNKLTCKQIAIDLGITYDMVVGIVRRFDLLKVQNRIKCKCGEKAYLIGKVKGIGKYREYYCSNCYSELLTKSGEIIKVYCIAENGRRAGA
jgi:tetrahydromethanopterin S-methyltransferase subunit G